jgi:ComEC/Rec2-related protein
VALSGVLRFLESEPRRFSPPLAAAFGMALGFYPGPPAFLPAIVIALAIASLGLALLPFGGTRRLRAAQALALGIGLVSGAAVAWTEAGHYSPSRSGLESRGLAPAWAEGRLAIDSAPAKNGFRSYAIKVERLGLIGRGLRAELSFPQPERRGSLRILSRAGPEVDSGSLVRVQGSFSEPGDALFAQSRDILVVDRGGFLDRARSAARSACRAALARVGRRSSGLLQALILGVRDSLAPEESEAFKAAGCSHILALSGEHLSVLAVLAIAALKPLLGPIRARLGGALLASLFMWIAGAGPSLLRSVLMVWIGAIALRMDRPQDWLTTLSLAFIMMVPIDPAGARSLSFTLSYLAVWGLAVLGPRFSFALGGFLPPFLRESASAALAAQAAVSPLLVFSFGYLQFAGIPASMLAGPVVTATMWWGMGSGLVCSFLPFASPLAIPVSDFLYRVLMGIMNAAAACPAIALASTASRILAVAAVAGLAAFVYARPYAEYRAAAKRGGGTEARLRLAPVPAGPPRGGGLGHVQALRPELPRQPPLPRADTRGAQGGERIEDLGDRSRHRLDDRPRPRRGSRGHGLRDRLRLRPPAEADFRG